MKTKNVYFPYPVLGIGDNIKSKPHFEASINNDKKDYLIIVKIDIANVDIKNYVLSGVADYVCEIDCPSTYYRKAVFSKSGQFEIRIPRVEVANRVTLQFTVTAAENINGYKNSELHDDYKDFVFNLEPGDLLAYIGEAHFDADIKYEKLKSADSILTIVEGIDSKYTNYYLGHDKIEIQLPPDLYADYRDNFNKLNSFANIFHSSLAFNALVFALSNYDSDYKDKLWARTIFTRIEMEPRLKRFQNVFIDKDPMELMQLAQELLGDPYRRLFKTMKLILDNLNSQEE